MGFRRNLKLALAATANATGTLGIIRRLKRRTLSIFGYHRVVPDVSAASVATMPSLCVSLRTFSAHLDHMARCYDVVSFDAAAALLSGDGPVPRRDAAIITFDDGYRDVLEHAAPVLRQRGMPATVFVTTDTLDGGWPLPHDRLHALMLRARAARLRLLGLPVPDRLIWPLARSEQALADGDAMAATDALLGALPAGDVERITAALEERVGAPGAAELPRLLEWGDLAQLADSGWAVGAHGASHVHLPLIEDERLVAEVADPRARIAARLGAPPVVLSYPAGRYDERVIDIARAAGYLAAVTTEDRKNPIGCDLFRLGRKVLTDEHGRGRNGEPAPALVAAQLDGLFSSLGLSRAVPGDQGLESPWL
jgi:peptidoglycan/xylan/chitin deacetylase (PgdA/CDA1 family)